MFKCVNKQRGRAFILETNEVRQVALFRLRGPGERTMSLFSEAKGGEAWS